MSDPASKSDLNELRRRISEDMKAHIGAFYEKLSGAMAMLSEQMTTMDKRLARVEKKVEVLTDTVGDIKLELTAVNDKLDRKADRSQITQLDRRVTVLEAK